MTDTPSLAVPTSLVALGVSERELQVLSTLLAVLPAHLPAPILSCTCCSAPFVEFQPERLAPHVSLQVKAAQERDLPLAGWIYVAPFIPLLEALGKSKTDREATKL